MLIMFHVTRSSTMRGFLEGTEGHLGALGGDLTVEKLGCAGAGEG